MCIMLNYALYSQFRLGLGPVSLEPPLSGPHPYPYYYYTFPHRKIRVIQFAGVLPRDVPSLPVAQPISFL